MEAIKPKAICALGGTAAQAQPGTKDGVMRLRGRWYKWHDIRLMVTYDPSYLLRPYNHKRQARSVGGPEVALHFVCD